MTTINPALLPVIAPPDLPDVARDAVDRVMAEAGRVGVDPVMHAGVMAGEMIGSARWVLDPAVPSDLSAAEWAMRHVAAAEAELATLRAAADEYHAQIDEWFDDASRRARTTAAFFAPHLEHYQRRRREMTDDATLKLPSGVVKTRKYQPSIEVDDEAAVIAWAERVGLDAVLVKRDPKLKKAELNRLARARVVTDGDGAIVDTWVEADVDDPDVPETVPDPETDGIVMVSARRIVPGVHVVAGHVDVSVVPRGPVETTAIEA